MSEAPLVDTYRGTVMPWHCDHMGHMNVMWYVGKFDEATWQFFSLLGLSGEYMRTARRALVAVDQRLQYRQELLAGDVLEIRSGITELKPKALLFFHEMRNSITGAIAATSRYVGVHIDYDTRKSVPIPPELLERGRQYLRRYDFGDAP
jgi:acyl-CoA thioester hydrolase